MKYYIVVCFIALTSCNIELDSPFQAEEDQKLYIIKRGEHESNRSISTFEEEQMSFSATFDESAIYQTTEEANQADINKLMGFSDCSGHHHENSARFGWRWYNDELEIHAYCYVDGDRVTKYITSVAIGEPTDYLITKEKGKYVFQVGSTSKVEISRNNECEGNVNYMLFPYFGGDEVAPHDISVNIVTD